MQVNDISRKWELHDERRTVNYRVKLFMNVGESKILSSILKKFKEVYEGGSPQSVPLTEEEIEMMNNFSEDLGKIS